mgnify:CR=1 FL=1
MSVFPEEFKKELVLCFKFMRTGTKWTQHSYGPMIVRLPTKDCSNAYREPELLGSIDDAIVEVRIYDELGIDIRNDPTLVGDWKSVLKRCEEFLEAECKKAPGHECDEVVRAS